MGADAVSAPEAVIAEPWWWLLLNLAEDCVLYWALSSSTAALSISVSSILCRFTPLLSGSASAICRLSLPSLFCGRLSLVVVIELSWASCSSLSLFSSSSSWKSNICRIINYERTITPCCVVFTFILQMVLFKKIPSTEMQRVMICCVIPSIIFIIIIEAEDILYRHFKTVHNNSAWVIFQRRKWADNSDTDI